MQNYYMTVVMAVDKRCAASGRALQAESAASEIQRVKKIHSRKTLQYPTNACTKDNGDEENKFKFWRRQILVNEGKTSFRSPPKGVSVSNDKNGIQ